MRETHSRITINTETVVKWQPPLFAVEEYKRTVHGQNIANRSELFIVPKILDYNELTGLIVFERLSGFERISTIVSDPNRFIEIINRVAAILAMIHKSSMVHGDFCLRNILYNSLTEELAVIDWHTPSWLKSEIERKYGIYLDLGIFSLPVFIHRLWEREKVQAPEVVMDSFLRVYLCEGDIKKALSAYSAATHEILINFLDTRIGLRAQARKILCVPSINRLKRYLMQVEKNIYDHFSEN